MEEIAPALQPTWRTGAGAMVVVAKTMAAEAMVVFAVALAVATTPTSTATRAKVGAALAILHDVAATQDLHCIPSFRFA